MVWRRWLKRIKDIILFANDSRYVFVPDAGSHLERINAFDASHENNAQLFRRDGGLCQLLARSAATQVQPKMSPRRRGAPQKPGLADVTGMLWIRFSRKIDSMLHDIL